jgi:superfamily II DNA/RNA helicase
MPPTDAEHRGPRLVVVGTPGRVLDLIKKDGGDSPAAVNGLGSGGAVLDLSRVAVLVLDEADRMLERGGFLNNVLGIARRCSAAPRRQTLFFSATWPGAVGEAVERIVGAGAAAPTVIRIGEENAAAAAGSDEGGGSAR